MRDGSMEISGFQMWLKSRFGQNARFNEPMSRHTSLQVGGPADCLVTVEELPELMDLLAWAAANGQPVFAMGRGTNLLVTQGGIRGIVIRLGKGFSSLEVIERSRDAILVRAGAGAGLPALCRFAAREGLSGMNFAAGIPGAVGGAVMMNAGTASGSISGRVQSLALVTAGGNALALRNDQVRWAYRKADLGEDAKGSVVTRVELRLSPGDPAALEKELDALLAARKQSQPAGKSCGCFFKNPPQGSPAGMLIERAGLKGVRVGGAEVSAIHANFLINAGHATAGDMIGLMNLVREKVAAASGVELEPEVRIIGA